MMWDAVLEDAIVPALEGDNELVAALGGLSIFMAQASRPVRVPSVEWIVTDDAHSEVFNPLEIQLDYWARGPQSAAAIERRLRKVLHHDVRRTMGGIEMATLFEDAFTHEYLAEPGVVHRSLRFRFEPVRER